MDSAELEGRCKKLAVELIALVRDLPYRVDTAVIGKQLIRSGCSVGANYRAALRARSTAEFYAKLCIVVEEVDETCYWLEIMRLSRATDSNNLEVITNEAEALTRIFAATRKSVRKRLSKGLNT